MPQRISVFSLAKYPVVGGAEIALREIIKRLPDLEFEIFSHDFDRYGYGKLAKFFYIFRAWRAAERAHKTKPFTAIWAMMAAYGGIAALFFKLRHPRIPMLLTLQEGDSEEHILRRVGPFYFFWKLIFKRAERVQVISSYLGDFARRHGAVGLIDVVPNGVSLDLYRDSAINRNNKVKTIITTSRLVNKNGVDILIDAVKLLKEPVRLEILGDGPQWHALELRARNLPDNLEINFRGHVEPGQIPEYLAKADIFVRASRSEGLGNSFLEAMAAGLPIIGTPVGGIPDFLNDEETGVFAKPEDPEDLAKKISLLLRDEKLRKRVSENGKKLVWENYTWEKIASRMSDIFFRTIKDTSNPRIMMATGIYTPDIGGPATYTKLLEEELPKRAFKVDHLAFTEFRKKPKIIRHLLYFFACLRKFRGFDVVYAQDPVSVGLPSLLAARLLRKKFFIRVAGDYAWEQAVQRFGVKDGIDDFQNRRYGWRTELLRKIQTFVVGNADLVVTPSKYFQKLVGGWIRNPEKVRVIYNGIQLARSSQELPSPSLRASTPRSGRGNLTIFSVGRLVPWKGFDVLIELMKDLPDWRLVIVGDGPEYQNLKLKIKDLKLEEKVQLAGAIPREEMLNLLSQSSIFVLNTSFESFSFAVVEAMNVGLPVITTNIGNLAEIVENGKEGILVSPNNKEQILSAVKKISENKEFREMIIENAKEKAQHFSISKTVDNLVNLIHESTSR